MDLNGKRGRTGHPHRVTKRTMEYTTATTTNGVKLPEQSNGLVRNDLLREMMVSTWRAEILNNAPATVQPE